MCRSSQFITMRWICFSSQCREHTIKASSASTMICWNQVIQGRHICTDGRISS
ncbi:unnamed protein product, partial [Vitis vinifera]|uniref:Uncharacterized protein n=1 Tax=Vitis vinifera TaxID=29760 RepID=D7SKP9_VITVI